jgi:tetratricopeptide (TPR) repeat protein
LQQGSYKECEGLYRTAIEVIESSLGPEHSEMVDVLYKCVIVRGVWGCNEIDCDDSYSLGRLLKTNGVYPEALRLYERAIEIVERCYGTEHYKYTMLLIAIGDVERKVCEAQPVEVAGVWKKSTC